jgi:shikimate 5-dehydrogenase
MRNTVKSFLTNDPFENWEEGTVALGGIVGGERPSKYSRSPDLWNGFFKALGLKGRFGAFDLPRADFFGEFAQAVLGLPGFIDLTVTNPYTAAAYSNLESLPHEPEIRERALRLQSLNHILCNPNTREIVVDNTAGQGFVRALEKRFPLEGRKVLLAGAGCVALAIGYELIQEGVDLSVVNIIRDETHKMAGILSRYRNRRSKISIKSWDTIQTVAPSCDIIISAISSSTPMESSAIEKLPAGCLLADVRYGENAEFAQAARRTGRTCVDGKEMLYGQFRIAAEICGGLLGFAPELIQKHLDDIENWFINKDDFSAKDT